MKILITGNGFDLAHGLPTSYNNFIETLNYIDRTVISDIKTDYGSYFKYNQHFKIDKLTNNYIFNPLNILLLKEMLNNKWFEYFRNQYDIDTWIDFESALEDALKMLNNQINNFNKNIFELVDFTEFTEFKNDKLGRKDLLNQLLVHFGVIKISPNKKGFRFNKDFCRTSNSTVYSFNEKKYFDSLVTELESFIDIFDMYLNTFVTPLIAILDKNKATTLSGVNKHFTFNYTTTFSQVYSSEIKTNFLHGKISDESNKNNIVLGFNDVFESVNNMKNFIPFTKYYQKLIKETDYKFLNDVKSSVNVLKIYFWGHSLDISDKVYIEEVFEINKRRNGIIKVFYHDSESKKSLFLNLINIFNGSTIVELQKDNKLEFIESTEENLKKELGMYDTSDPFYGITFTDHR